MLSEGMTFDQWFSLTLLVKSVFFHLPSNLVVESFLSHKLIPIKAVHLPPISSPLYSLFLSDLINVVILVIKVVGGALSDVISSNLFSILF